MNNALPEIIESQRKAFEALGEPLEQVQHSCSHGQFLTQTLRKSAAISDLDVVVFFDLDCIPLKTGVVAKAVSIALKNATIVGCAQQANHIEISKYLLQRSHRPWLFRKIASFRRLIIIKLGMDPYKFKNPLIYAGPCFLVVPIKVYKQVGQPSLEAIDQVDVAAQLTIACRKHGIRPICLQPTYCHQLKYKLGNTLRFGLGTIYGNCIFHAFETTYLSNQKSTSLFQEYCDKVIQRHTSKGAY